MNVTRLTIGQVAKAVGLNPRTIRFYERCGLLKAGRTLSRYRIFDAKDLTRLRLVKQLRKLGFSIEETKRVLPLFFDSLPHRRRTQELKGSLKNRLAVAEKNLRELGAIYRELQIRLDQFSSKRKSAKDRCCEPFCGPETCGPGLVQLTGLKAQATRGGGG